MPHYREILNTIPKDRKIVFYVIDCLTETGGMERRLALQFDWLMRHGIQPVLVIEDQGYPPLNGYPCLKLLQWAPNAREIFMNLVREVNPLAVEFHMKSPRFFHEIDLEAIAVQIEFVHTGNIGSKCLQFDVQPLVFENKPLLARKELQLAVAGTPPRGLTRAF